MLGISGSISLPPHNHKSKKRQIIILIVRVVQQTFSLVMTKLVTSLTVLFLSCSVSQNGCNVNSQTYSGNTALHIASGRGEVEAVRALLKNGADSSLKNYYNDTAVMVAKNKKVRN